MSCNRWLAAALLLGISTASCATSKPHYECPAFVHEGDSTHTFSHIDVFDGPPQNMGSLIPTAIKNGAQWDMTKKADLYLVCGYKGTDKTITVHAPGTTVCKALDTPGTTAFCEQVSRSGTQLALHSRDMAKGADIYLVCGYKSTDKKITVHAPGVTVCKSTNSPSTAYCDQRIGTSHAAIYLGQTAQGIQVPDQWKGHAGRLDHPPQQRTIHFHNGISSQKVNQGESYYVVQ